MKLSREKINQIANAIMSDFEKRDELDYIAEPLEVRLQIVKVMTDVMSVDDEADSTARRKLNSLSNRVVEGSNEWEIMYQKYHAEEMNKKGL